MSATINNYCSLSQVKRKLKSHLCDTSHENLKINNFSQSIVFTLVDILDELINDSLKYVLKNDITGLYKLNTVVIKLVINEMPKYNICLKYLPKFSTSINYQDLLLFNYKKTLLNIENKLGNKLMIEHPTLNLISYLLLSIQYDLINLSVLFVEYSKKKTLSKNTLLCSMKSLLDDELSSKIKLKLDCVIQDKECGGDEEEEEVGDSGGEEDTVGEEESEEAVPVAVPVTVTVSNKKGNIVKEVAQEVDSGTGKKKNSRSKKD
jgi:hypothetical protein